MCTSVKPYGDRTLKELPNMKNVSRHYFDMNPEKLREFWHNSAVKSLLKEKARAVASKLPRTERIVYAECSREAKSLAELARCVVLLLDARDRMAREETKRPPLRKIDLSPIRAPSPVYTIPLYSTNQVYHSILQPIPAKEFKATSGIFSPLIESTRGRVNPKALTAIRPQRRRKMLSRYHAATENFVRRDQVLRDEIDDAYELFLLEERLKMKESLRAVEHEESKSRKFPRFTERKRPVFFSEVAPTSDMSTSAVPTFTIPSKRGPQPTTEYVEPVIITEPQGTGGVESLDIRQFLPSRQLEMPPLVIKAARMYPHNPVSTTIERGTDRNHLGLPRHVVKTRRKRSVNVSYESPPKANADELRKVAMITLESVLKMNGQHFNGTMNTRKLRQLKEHYDRVNSVNEYFKNMNEANKRFIAESDFKIDMRDPRIQTLEENDLVNDLLNVINSFQGLGKKNRKISIMSPKLLSIFPDTLEERRERVFSPNLLSFQRDGYFSLPDLFRAVSGGISRYEQIFIELIMEMSGASIALDKVISSLEGEMRHMKEVQYPMVEKLRRMDANWERAERLYSPSQRSEIANKGYTFMTPEQIRLIYEGQAAAKLLTLNLDEYGKLTTEQKEARLEKDIRRLAALLKPEWPGYTMSKKSRRKRADDNNDGHPDDNNPKSLGNSTMSEEGSGNDGNNGNEDDEEDERVNGILFETLSPRAFSNLISRTTALEAVVLSPRAFLGEFLLSEALVLDLLSPQAFIASVLSPSALVARVLSPTALRGEVLGPRALTAWVLSPEALIAEVLTPRLIEPRVLSPETLVIDVLSPGILSPHIHSSESLGILVLSPNILSPRIESSEDLLIEILSPHILGGHHDEEEEEHGVIEVPEHEDEKQGASEHGETLEQHHLEDHSHRPERIGPGRVKAVQTVRGVNINDIVHIRMDPKLHRPPAPPLPARPPLVNMPPPIVPVNAQKVQS